MYTMSAGYKKKSRSFDIISIITAISIALCLISLSVKIVINANYLYYYDIDHLNIVETAGMSKSVIKENYDLLMKYMNNNNVTELSLPDFPMSPQGKEHFAEVKVLFNDITYLFYGTLALSTLGIIASIVKKKAKVFKASSIIMILIPIILAIPFAVDFNGAFTVFHKLAFSNDFWEFDPASDPIINALPENYFMHCAVGILLLVTLFSILSYLVSRILKKRFSRSAY
ncbi:MAG: TIGR01906 family membrane protein [Bacillota bacterium]|nr:TIGR01906 family membrane protein [Bacillota bacterium]